MKTALIVIVVIVVVLVGWGVSANNHFVTLNENINGRPAGGLSSV